MKMKEKFPSGISTDMFEMELRKEPHVILFLKATVKNIEKTSTHNKSNILPTSSLIRNSFSPVNIKVSDKNFHPHPDSTCSFKRNNSPSVSKISGLTSPNYFSPPVLPSSFTSPSNSCPSSSNNISLGFGIQSFVVLDVDLQKEAKYLAKKYKMNYLEVSKIILNKTIPILTHKDIKIANNCYFRFNNEDKNNISIPCNWLSVQGGSAGRTHLVYVENNNGELNVFDTGSTFANNKRECYKLVVKQYRAECCPQYINFRYNLMNNSFSQHLYLFIGKPGPQCKCITKIKKFEIIKNNKNVKTAYLYNQHHSVFSSPREIYNLRRKLNNISSLNSLVQKRTTQLTIFKL